MSTALTVAGAFALLILILWTLMFIRGGDE